MSEVPPLQFFQNLVNKINTVFWSYFLIFFILISGIYLTYYFVWPQKKILLNFFKKSKKKKETLSPMNILIASLSASIGPANIIYVADSVLSVGIMMIPFIWVGAFFGSVLKYCEIYLAIKYREKNNNTFYGGGYITIKNKLGFSIRHIVSFFIFLLTILYTIEFYQFGTFMALVKNNFNISTYPNIIIACLLCILILIFSSKIKTIVRITSFIVPAFLAFYFLSGFWIIFCTIKLRGTTNILCDIKNNINLNIKNILACIYAGISSSFYSSEVCIGIDASVQSESSAQTPEEQSYISGLAPIIDSICCTFTSVLVFVSSKIFVDKINSFTLLNSLYEKFIPMGKWLFFFLLVLSTYSTIGTYFSVGQKLLNSKIKKYIYYILVLLICTAGTVVSLEALKSLIFLLSGILVFCNLSIILMMKKKIKCS